MKSKAARFSVIVLVLALSGAALNRFVQPAWAEARAREPALRLASVGTATGQGTILAVLGGFRALVADVTWIRMFVGWEQRDLAGTDTLLRLVPALDPRPEYFWLNGARIMANDLPTWRIALAGGYEAVPRETQQRINREQGTMALEHLEAGRAFHPQSAEFWIERANIQLNRLGDVAAAAESYRQAWAQPRGPYYAARLHAELLRRLGRDAEALAWLRQLHPGLPKGDEAAAADLVLGRIRELEQKLGIPSEQAYRSVP